jgi:guanylate cyclase activator 1
VLSDGEVNKRLEWMFEVYDINNDGAIDRKEIETIIKAILKMNKKQLVGDQTNATKIDEIFDKLDDNENEKVSKEEFVSNCSNNVFLRDILVPQV